MGLTQLLLPLLATVAFTNGAAIQSADMLSLDSLINMFVSNIENLDGWASSMGLTRNKREVTHGDYTTYNYKGIKVGYKVGEAFIHIDNLKAMVPAAHSKEVEVHVHFDGGASLDGIFEFEIDYFLTHFDGDGKESGKLNLKRTKENGKFVTALKTTAPDFDGETIIPAAIRNVDLELSSDRKKFLHVKYVNPYRKKNTDLTFTLIQGALPALEVKGTRAGKTVDLKLSIADLDFAGQKMELKVEGTTSGHLIISRQKIELDIGNEAIFQLGYSPKKHTITINTQSKKIKAAVKKLNVMNHITFPLQLKVTELKFKNSDEKGYKLTEPTNNVEISLRYDPTHPGNFGAKASRGGRFAWKIGTKVIEKVYDDKRIAFKSESNMKLDKSSKLYQLIDTYYPLGGFEERKATIDFSTDLTTKNFLYPKFNLHANIVKDKENVFDLVGNTVNRPYKFSLVAPNLRKLIPDRGAEGIEIVIDHDIGKSLNIKSNGFGGLEFDAKRSANANGGYDIHVGIFKAKVKMLSYDLHTTFVNNDKKLDFTLNGKLHLDKNSLIYKNIVSNYKILTPFNDRVGNIHILVDKLNKNVVLNKFRITADTTKDGKEVLNIIADTTSKPYKFKLFAPEIRNRFGLDKITKGDDGIFITVDHELGDHLEVIANLKNWSGMKIVTKGTKKDVFWNGKPLGEGEFEVGDKYIILGGKKKGDGVILKDGDNIKVKLSLEGNNPLKNKLIVDVKGNKRKLDATLEYDVTNLDFDIDTPSAASLTLTAEGMNPRLGFYKLTRDGKLSSEGHIVHVTWTGDASWGKTKIYSPIHTDFDFSFDADKKDLVGTFSKTIGGKLYSIKFPKGTGAMALPQITMG